MSNTGVTATSESVDYALVESKMGELDLIFEDYYKILTDMDTFIEEEINTGDEAALNAANIGKDFLAKWNSAADQFGALKLKFETLNANVAQVTKNDESLEAEATSLFYGTGTDAPNRGGKPTVGGDSSREMVM